MCEVAEAVLVLYAEKKRDVSAVDVSAVIQGVVRRHNLPALDTLIWVKDGRWRAQLVGEPEPRWVHVH